MHVADRRHGLDVVASLRAEASRSRTSSSPGLLHDAGKGDTGVWPRVAYTLGSRYGAWIRRVAGVLPGFAPRLERLRDARRDVRRRSRPRRAARHGPSS